MVGWMEFNRTRKNKNKQSSDLLKVRWSSDFFLGNLIFLEFHNKVGLVFSFNWQSMVGIDNRFLLALYLYLLFCFLYKAYLLYGKPIKGVLQI